MPRVTPLTPRDTALVTERASCDSYFAEMALLPGNYGIVAAEAFDHQNQVHEPVVDMYALVGFGRRQCDLARREIGDSYTDEGIDIWLHARNRNLDMRRPIDLIVEGQIEKVIDQAKWVAGGM